MQILDCHGKTCAKYVIIVRIVHVYGNQSYMHEQPSDIDCYLKFQYNILA